MLLELERATAEAKVWESRFADVEKQYDETKEKIDFEAKADGADVAGDFDEAKVLQLLADNGVIDKAASSAWDVKSCIIKINRNVNLTVYTTLRRKANSLPVF